MSARAFYALESWVGAAVLAATFAGGCANLEVKKVPVEERAAHGDTEQGFRYYLNRPYLLVKKAILVKETRSLVIVKKKLPCPQSESSGKEEVRAQDANGPQFTFLTGPRQGQTVRLADLRVENPGTGACREFTTAELQRIAAVVKEDDGNNGEGSSLPDDQSLTVSAALTSSNSGNPGSQQGAPNSGGQNASSTEVQQPALAAVQHTPPLSGDIGIVYLPDLDEQYVIKSCNFASKSSFALAIRNGSELVEVQGDHDSTALPLSILQQVQNAIQAAVSSEQSKSQQSSGANQQGGGKPGLTKGSLGSLMGQLEAGDLVFQMIERTFIKPGVYRLNKPWETDCGGNTVTPVGCGLLAKLGLPQVTEVDFQPSASITK